MNKQEFFIYGRKPVLEALQAGKRFDKILLLKGATGSDVMETMRISKENGVPCQFVPKEKLDGVAQKYSKYKEANHQGMIGFLSIIDYYTLDDVLSHIYAKGETPLLLVLDGITDVGNFGAIARSAECLGAHAIVVPAQGSAQINAESIKTSAGALNKILVCRELSLIIAVKYLKANGIRIVGTAMEGAVPIELVEFSEPMAVVLGSEGEGVSSPLLKLCDEHLMIPMTGTIPSLNVSVSAGIILYEIQRKRSRKP